MQQFIDHLGPKYRISKRYRVTTKSVHRKPWDKITERLKLNNFYSHFAVEIMLFFILIFAVGTNLSIKANYGESKGSNRSLFFSYLKSNPSLNNKLVDAYESVNLKLSQSYSLVPQVLAAQVISKTQTETVQEKTPLATLSGSTLLKPNPAESLAMTDPKKDIEQYEVRGGDTLGQIAAKHNLSINTVLWANNLSEKSLIRPGTQLAILPTDGVMHIVKSGETISGIAKLYGLTSEEDVEQIFADNEIEHEELIQIGEELFIRNGEKKATTPQPTPQRKEYLANLKKNDTKQVQIPSDYKGANGDFLWPVPNTRKISQYASRKHMGLDIPCRGGCMAVASADGIVELAGWQTGYGYTIVINHGNGTKTRYAHAQELVVTAGDTVTAGQNVLIIGSTGRSTGPHLHFEIKINGTLKNPLDYLK